MNILRQTLQKTLKTGSEPEITPALRCRLEPSPLQWSSEELEALLFCEQHKPLCSVHNLHDAESSAQTLLIGCDIFAGRLLLDEFFPQINHTSTGSAIKLILPAKAGRLHVRAIVEERVDTQKLPCVLACITDKYYLADRRVWPRTHFAATEQPAIKLSLPMQHERPGRLLNVSASGFLMSIPALDKPFHSGETGQCHIQFHEQFRLRAKVKVQSVRLLRKPYRHTVIRGIFLDLTDVERERLSQFVLRHKRAAESLYEY